MVVATRVRNAWIVNRFRRPVGKAEGPDDPSLFDDYRGSRDKGQLPY
jgi:hypothetical protein